MPRKVREVVDGGIYHVYARGNNGQQLFDETRDYECYMGLLGAVKKKYHFNLYHYCLMPNHMHMLLKVEEGKTLSRMMHWVQLGYTRYYKGKYGYYGHVYQGRFRSPRISDESYYLQCGRYIERNPVRGGMTQECADYEWSSARFYVKGIRNALITPNPFYQEMGETVKERQERYHRFLSLDEPYSAMVDEGLGKL